MSDATAPIDCPDGHSETTRLLSVFASVGRSGGGDSTPTPTGGGFAGGCGAGCACAS